MAENIYNWQYNTIPGNANQGAILLTRNDIGQPPFNQSDFIWKAMEDVIGVADVKLEYNVNTNEYILYKAKGHLDNEDQWTKNWRIVGTWPALTQEVVDALRLMTYIRYDYDTTEPDTLKVLGTKKDGTSELIVDIHFASKDYVDQAIANLKQILVSAPLTSTDSGNNRTLGLNYDTNDFKISNTGALQSNIIDDTQPNATNKALSAYYITHNLFTTKWEFKGTVADKTALPDNMPVGSVYGVENEGDLYVYLTNPIGWYPFTYIAESFNSYGIELHKGTNGLYGKLRYDTLDFTIDNANNLKSQIIDDTIGGSDPNANKKTYSIEKILQLLTSSMRYKGQVSTSSQLPSTGNETGDVYNVIDTGDNYAWNGTSWDNLSGEYTAGAGIVISGKVISATGINFNIGQGLQVEGAGSTAVLSTKTGNGLSYTDDGTLRVRAGLGTTVNSLGVSVNAGNTTRITTNNLIEVKPENGLIDKTTGLAINANFNIKSTPLGTESSKLALYSDGKIGIDFTESPVVISGELLASANLAIGSNTIASLSIPNLNKYDMIAIEYETSTMYYPKGITTVRQANIVPDGIGSAGTAPNGSSIYMLLIRSIDWTSNTMNNIEWWYKTSFGSGSWSPTNATASSNRYIKVYGMKAR